jgi:hypothetical protein
MDNSNKGRLLFRSTAGSIAAAAVIFCVIGIIFDISNKGTMYLTDYSFTKMAIGAFAVGLGFGVPSIVYQNENISLLIKTLIHMGIGCAVLLITGYLVGWIPVKEGPVTIAAYIAGEVALAFVIWAFYYHSMKKMAKEMNDQITYMKKNK